MGFTLLSIPPPSPSPCGGGLERGYFSVKKIVYLIFALGLFITTHSLALPLIMEVHSLKHRSADEIIPLLKPFMHKEGAMTGKGYKLIIKTTPKNLEEIKSLLEELDTGLRQLLITVAMDEQAMQTQQGASISGQSKLGGKGTVSVNAHKNTQKGVTVGAADKNTQVQAHVYRTDSRRNQPGTQYLRVSEGQWAIINVGTSFPVRTRNKTPYGTETERVTYKDVSSGFQVLPRIHGQEVTLHIKPQRASLNLGNKDVINTHSIDTVVSGKLGEWIKIGGAMQTVTAQQDSIAHSTEDHSTLTRHMAIKVEIKP